MEVKLHGTFNEFAIPLYSVSRVKKKQRTSVDVPRCFENRKSKDLISN